MGLAGQLGSDVPFFLGTSLALCSGRGERLTALPAIPSMEVVLIRPPVSLGTADVYRRSTVPADPRKIPTQFMNGTIRSASGLPGMLFNRLQTTACQLSHWLPQIEDEFSRAPFVAHQMSGSGSTYFGICRTRQDAKRAQQQLRAASVGCVIRTKTGSLIGIYQAGTCTN
jgi:4-diphosphocytidyl-2-C-methyl-D-erythritol kinase